MMSHPWHNDNGQLQTTSPSTYTDEERLTKEAELSQRIGCGIGGSGGGDGVPPGVTDTRS